MALADYRLCDVCGNKAFYDANLNYTFAWDGEPIPEDEKVREADYKLDYLGDWAVLCRDCAKTHVAVVMKKEDIGSTEASTAGVDVPLPPSSIADIQFKLIDAKNALQHAAAGADQDVAKVYRARARELAEVVSALAPGVTVPRGGEQT